MNYVVEACLPLRRSSPAPPRSPYLSGCAGGACGSGSTSDCSQSGGSAGAAVSTEAAEADVEKSRHPEPLFEQTYTHPQQHAAVPPCYSESGPVSPHHPNEEEEAHLHHEKNSAQLHKYLSLSTYGDSASNLTTLGNTASATTTAATTATNTSASVTGSSEASTPLSGASSHQQQRIRAIAQRVVLEANQLRHSLDSRSNSSTHRDNNEEEEEEEATSRAVDPAVPDTVSPAAAAVASTHFTSRSTPSSKRPRQTQTQTQSSTEAAERAMHIPDITTFADSSPARPTTPMTTANASPLPADASGARSTTTARVQDRVDYEGEISRAVESRYTAENTATAATVTVVKVPTMAAGSNSATHAVAPDATPQEPPPKRFATGEDADMEELGYAVLHRSSADGHKASSDVVSQPSPAVETVGMEENEEAAGQRPTSVRRHRRHPATTATANAEEEEEDGVQSESTANGRHGDRRGSAASRRAAGTNAHGSGKEGRRKTRLTNSSGVGSLLGGGRYTNDSITASIPYDPTRFNTPPLAQQPQSEDSPFTQSSSSVPLRPEAAVAATAGRQASESQPSCATPPDAKPAPPATTAVPQQQQQQPEQQSYQPPPTAPSVKLTETRYAFLALSFMMRMLCKLHKGEPIPSSDFHSHCIPPMSVTMYVQRLVRYCACSGEALLCSFVLLLKYVFHSGHPITIYNAHRLLITSILLGIKLRDDVYYSNVYYGRIGGISGREMNKLEVLFLSKLDWETQVYEDEYAALLSLLQEIAVDVDPTPEQLAAFAAMYPEKVASYEPDDDDDELEEAAAKLQQGGSTTSAAAAAAAAPSPTIARTNGNAEAAASSAEVQRRKTLRGAYRLHQWHTKVEPWIAQLQQHVFARRTATAQAMSAAWQEEGQRWAQYYQDDEEAAARLQRERSASAWLSPLSVQKRATSAATVLPAQPQGGNNGESWIVEPPYHSAWPPVEASAYHGVGSASNYTSQQQTSAQQEETNPRYSNFINFANVVTGGYFGPSGSATSNSAPPATGNTSGSAANRFVSPASMGGPTPSSTTAASGSGHHYGIGGGVGGNVQRVSSAPGVASASTVRYHTAAAGASTTSAGSGPLRQSSATFDITNRAATTAAPSPSFGSGAGGNAEHGCHSENNSRHSRGSLSGTFQHTAAAQPPSVSGTTLRAASPASSSVPGSGINVNAQPYYYVSSRMRKQQQQQQLELSATLGEAPTASAAAASPSEANDPCSLSSSFTSPACVNPPTRFSTAYASVSGVTPSSGMEAVLAAMKRSTTHTVQDAHDNMHGSSSGPTTAATSAGLTFPARPIAKTAVGASHEGEQGASVHMPRRSPQSAHPPATHRRSTYASQHSLGKKRSKPDSYKDY